MFLTSAEQFSTCFNCIFQWTPCTLHSDGDVSAGRRYDLKDLTSESQILRRQLTVEVATAHKVAGMFGRRDPMRKYMDKITALADDLGAAPPAAAAGSAAVPIMGISLFFSGRRWRQR